MKKVRVALAAITAALCMGNLCGSAFCSFEASAKVVEPEIVYTETWTTSYFIDDDMDTLYPYIDCQADIYNDGTMTVHFWNTHEWDGFATVKHRATIISSTNAGSPYVYHEGDIIIKSVFGDGVLDYDITQFDKSYFPTEYNCVTDISAWSGEDVYSYFVRKTSAYSYCSDGGLYGGFTLLSFYDALPNMPVNSKLSFTFTPTVEPVGNYEFHILGHDIMITPEILSGNTVAIPQLTEQEKQIQALETENALLKAENERLTAMSNADSILRLDTDGNGIIDAKDATTILVIYAVNSTGGDIKTLTELKEYITNKK